MRRHWNQPGGTVCPKTGQPMDGGRKYRWLPWVVPVVGLVSLIWFLIRVIPKPSRATYPCQRFVAPIASGFVVWLTGIVGSTLAYRKAKHLLGQSRYVVAGVFLAIAVAALWWPVNITSDNRAQAWDPSEPANTPMGVGQGILDLVGPLGRPAHIERVGRVLVIGGGIGTAVAMPIARDQIHPEDHAKANQFEVSKELHRQFDGDRDVDDRFVSAWETRLRSSPIRHQSLKVWPLITSV